MVQSPVAGSEEGRLPSLRRLVVAKFIQAIVEVGTGAFEPINVCG